MPLYPFTTCVFQNQNRYNAGKFYGLLFLFCKIKIRTHLSSQLSIVNLFKNVLSSNVEGSMFPNLETLSIAKNASNIKTSAAE